MLNILTDKLKDCMRKAEAETLGDITADKISKK